MDITKSGTYQVSNKMKIEIDTSEPLNINLFGNGGKIKKLTLDFNNMPAGSNINIDFTTFKGNPTINIKGFNSVDQISFNGATLQGVDPADPSRMIFSYVGADGKTHTGVFKLKGGGNWNNHPLVICFASGTMILTPGGQVPVEEIANGDLVSTWNGETRAVRWVGTRHVDEFELAVKPMLAPVRIHAGALGPSMPALDLLVSPQHRILLEGPEIELLFGDNSVLVPAISLVDGIRAEQCGNETGVTYHHILLDRHSVLVANGQPAESLFLGDSALAAMSDSQRDEITEIFPELPTDRGLSQTSCASMLRSFEASVASSQFGFHQQQPEARA